MVPISQGYSQLTASLGRDLETFRSNIVYWPNILWGCIMVVIYGDTKCLILEENLFRFLDSLKWAQHHKCLLKKRKVELYIKICGTLLVRDDQIDEEIELCEIYDYKIKCKTCRKEFMSSYEE